MKQSIRAKQKGLGGLPLGIATLAAGCALLAGACSLLLDTSVTQCTRDKDCQSFAGTVCDVQDSVCVKPRDAGTNFAEAGAPVDAAADTCVGPAGCFSCAPSNESEIISHCTDTICVPFDNKRLTLMADDGSLRPLP
jgi:hypothetical protein